MESNTITINTDFFRNLLVNAQITSGIFAFLLIILLFFAIEHIKQTKRFKKI